MPIEPNTLINWEITPPEVRGITLNCKNMLNVNFGLMKGLSQNDKMPQYQYATLTKSLETETWQRLFDKRVLLDQYISYPFGY